MSRLRAFADRAALIYGASEGTGFALARALGPHVRAIGIVSRSEAKIASALAELRAHSGKPVCGTTADVADGASVREAFDLCHAQLGDFGIVINCAGASHPGYFEDLPVEIFTDQINRHLIGSVNVFKTAIPHLKRQKSARLITTASVLGLVGMFGYSAYAASKHAVVGLVRALRSEYAPTGLRISVLCPPSIDTPGFAEENKIKPAEVLETELKGGIVSADKVAQAVLRALPRGPELILPGSEAQLPALLARFAPSILESAVARKA